MKPLIAALLVFSTATSSFAQEQVEIGTNCINADPSSTLASTGGDFELNVDPQDAYSNLLYVTNVASGASSVVIARIDGQSGQIIAGSLTNIANNFNGSSTTNGPEIVQEPTGEVGVLYAGRGGVTEPSAEEFRHPGMTLAITFPAHERTAARLCCLQQARVRTRFLPSRWDRTPTVNFTEVATASVTAPSVLALRPMSFQCLDLWVSRSQRVLRARATDMYSSRRVEVQILAASMRH